MNVGFESFVQYMPKETLNVREYYKYLNKAINKGDFTDDYKSLLPNQVRRLRDISAVEIMAVAAGNKALEACGLKPEDIDCLLVTQSGGKQFIPLVASYVHLNMGLRRADVLVENIVDDNASFINASYLAWNYVESGAYNKVLIIAVSSLIGGMTAFGADLTDPFCQFYGDGAGAAIVSKDNLKCTFEAYHFETYEKNVVPGYSRTGTTITMNFTKPVPLKNMELQEEALMEESFGSFFDLYNKEFVMLASQKGFITNSLKRCASKAGINIYDLDTVIASHYGYCEAQWKGELVDAGLKLDAFKNLRNKYGNTMVADIPIDLAEYDNNKLFAPGSYVACWTPTFGTQVASMILKWM